jgi:hypothetical protein
MVQLEVQRLTSSSAVTIQDRGPCLALLDGSACSGRRRHSFTPSPLSARASTPSDFEEDHLVSLELGGAPHSTRNLWPEPWSQAHRDDNGIEASLHRKLCDGTLTLRQAQA